MVSKLNLGSEFFLMADLLTKPAFAYFSLYSKKKIVGGRIKHIGAFDECYIGTDRISCDSV